MKKYDYIIVGSGFAGSICAAELARSGRRVLLSEKRDHIGGNAYDCFDEHGVLIHRYGPHIFHTDDKRVYEYLSRYTEWIPYEHKVLAQAGERRFPVPFNLNSLDIVYADRAADLADKLAGCYGEGARVSISELRSSEDPDIREVAEFVFENVFLHYTVKQWGKRPEDIDPETLKRVPIYISRDDRYFHDKYQGMPKHGYTEMFRCMLDHPNIDLKLCENATEHLSFTEEGILYDNELFEGEVIYTGAVDELFGFEYSPLPYRTLDFEFENHPTEYYQSHATVNYTVDMPYTRISEFKYMTGQVSKDSTTIVKEYSRRCEKDDGDIPYYAVINEDSCALYEKYREKAKKYQNLILLGRLAEYKYYNMDKIAALALELCDRLCAKDHLQE